MIETPSRTPADWLRLMHQQQCDKPGRPWAAASFEHAAPRSGGPGWPARLQYEATLVYPGTVVVTMGGETVAASRPGHLDVHVDYCPGPDDPYTHSERVTLLNKASLLLLSELRFTPLWWTIRSSDRSVIANGVAKVTGTMLVVMVTESGFMVGAGNQVFAVAEPGRPAVVDNAATAAARSTVPSTGGRHV